MLVPRGQRMGLGRGDHLFCHIHLRHRAIGKLRVHSALNHFAIPANEQELIRTIVVVHTLDVIFAFMLLNMVDATQGDQVPDVRLPPFGPGNDMMFIRVVSLVAIGILANMVVADIDGEFDGARYDPRTSADIQHIALIILEDRRSGGIAGEHFGDMWRQKSAFLEIGATALVDPTVTMRLVDVDVHHDMVFVTAGQCLVFAISVAATGKVMFSDLNQRPGFLSSELVPARTTLRRFS